MHINENIIEISDLSIKYQGNGPKVLNSVNLRIGRGETIALMGESGSGKSTLLSFMGCILSGNGKYLFSGRNIQELDDAELARFRGENIGFVFQSFHLLGHLTLLENVLMPLDHIKIGKSEKTKAMHLLEHVGLGDLANRFPHQISGGQAQRVATARALIRNPSVILADEPTGNLDKENESKILALLRSLSEAGTTIVIATHSNDIANCLDRKIRIDAGCLQ